MHSLRIIRIEYVKPQLVRRFSMTLGHIALLNKVTIHSSYLYISIILKKWFFTISYELHFKDDVFFHVRNRLSKNQYCL